MFCKRGKMSRLNAEFAQLEANLRLHSLLHRHCLQIMSQAQDGGLRLQCIDARKCYFSFTSFTHFPYEQHLHSEWPAHTASEGPGVSGLWNCKFGQTFKICNFQHSSFQGLCCYFHLHLCSCNYKSFTYLFNLCFQLPYQPFKNTYQHTHTHTKTHRSKITPNCPFTCGSLLQLPGFFGGTECFAQQHRRCSIKLFVVLAFYIT